jgi:hypothetical protein
MTPLDENRVAIGKIGPCLIMAFGLSMLVGIPPGIVWFSLTYNKPENPKAHEPFALESVEIVTNEFKNAWWVQNMMEFPECLNCKARKDAQSEFFSKLDIALATQKEAISNRIHAMESGTNTVLVTNCDLNLNELYRIYGTNKNQFVIVTGCRINGCQN